MRTIFKCLGLLFGMGFMASCDKPLQLGYFADSLLHVGKGSFEAVVIKKDHSVIRKEFGQIVDGVSNPKFDITLTSAEIVVK